MSEVQLLKTSQKLIERQGHLLAALNEEVVPDVAVGAVESVETGALKGAVRALLSDRVASAL